MSARGVVWLNGRFVRAERARVPVTSPALLGGAGVFETLRIAGGSAPLLERHAARLRSACAALGIPAPVADWSHVLCELARRAGLRDAQARITVAADLALATCEPLPAALASERQAGVAVRSVSLTRAAPGLKTTSRLPLALAERDAGGEVLLRGPAGCGLESSRANLFVVDGGALVTAPAPLVLPGIARALVLELAREQAIEARECTPSAELLARAAELFLTNAVRGVRPVAALDGRALPELGPDSLSRRLQRALDARMGIVDALKRTAPRTEARG